MSNYWIAVASKEHVKNGIKEGIMQVCHGKVTPLKRIKPGDGIIYYSPNELFGTKSPCKQFTALGIVQEGEPYQYKMSDDFIPYRRNVTFLKAKDIAIEPLIDTLSYIKNKKQWGFIFRYGLFKIPEVDFLLIASTMGVSREQYDSFNRKNNDL
jgi:hypothetical protein